MVSIKNVARFADVSVMTVSRVINASGYVSQKTRAKVLEAIDKTGYRVNQTAVGLRTGRSNSIGVIISDISNPFFPFIIKGIDYVCSRNNYDTILFNTGEDIDRELRYINLLKQKYVKGVIISSCLPDYEENQKIFAGLTPVFFNRKPKGIHADSVVNDDYQATFIATEYLIRKGNRKIALINGNMDISTFRERYRGFRAAMDRHAIPVCEELIAVGEYSIEGGYRSARKIFNASIRPEAILPMNNFMTQGLYNYLKEHRIRIPADVSVIGYNDLDWCSLVVPPLTVIKVKKFEMGKRAAEILCDRLQYRAPNSFQEIVLEPEFIIRGSVKSARHAERTPMYAAEAI
ncbi:MAG: LacI family DNA-binding transcriptional regulator [Desulfobacterales bacterium]|nr:MAG: LacI family DNA-binding transcriptional regulator [Desulfobacterales bacterium]